VTQKSPVLRAVDAELVGKLTELVARASAAILAVAPDALDTRLKADRTPVTAADKAADAVICEGLARLLPGIAVVSEERPAGAQAPGETFAIVDPLDGTKEFVAGLGEYTVNIALVTDGRPVAGFIAGATAPPGRRMGHAGAIISGGKGTAAAKIAAFEEAGIGVAATPSVMAETLAKMM